MRRPQRNSRPGRLPFGVALALGLAVVFVSLAVGNVPADEPKTDATKTDATKTAEPQAAPESDSQPRFTLERARGRVVFLGEAMQRRHGVKWVDEAKDRSLALETDDGRLLPLVEDIRGRGLRKDERLRKMHVELLMRQYAGVPVRQVIGVFELTKSGQFEIDYWCEICAIAMYELKECECCQGPIELRKRRVTQP